MAYKWGVILTAYDTWDYPPSTYHPNQFSVKSPGNVFGWSEMLCLGNVDRSRSIDQDSCGEERKVSRLTGGFVLQGSWSTTPTQPSCKIITAMPSKISIRLCIKFESTQNGTHFHGPGIVDEMTPSQITMDLHCLVFSNMGNLITLLQYIPVVA